MGAAMSCISTNGRQLLSAANNNSPDTVREVLEDQAELAKYAYFGSNTTAMHIAASKGHTEVLRAIVESLSDSARFMPDSEIDAMREKTLSVIRFGQLLKDVLNARTSNMQTPLMLACENGHVGCLNYLLDAGADVFAIDRLQRRSAIHYAAANGRANILRRLLDDSNKVHTEEGYMPLKNVHVHDMSGFCKYIDSRSENGATALHIAAIAGELACVNVLLAAGASMMVRTVDLDMVTTYSVPAGSTPLHVAAQRGHVAILQAMLQAHANAMGTWGRSGDTRGRRGWEGDGRIDLRSVANSLRQLPYHVAWQRGFREAAGILNPTVPIDVALENVREMDEGFGPQNLATLAAYALRRNLLTWLEGFQTQKEVAERELEQKARAQRVIAEQRRKEALQFHSVESVDANLYNMAAQHVSQQDAGHTYASVLRVAPASTSSPSGTQSPASSVARLSPEIQASGAEASATTTASVVAGLSTLRAPSASVDAMPRVSEEHSRDLSSNSSWSSSGVPGASLAVAQQDARARVPALSTIPSVISSASGGNGQIGTPRASELQPPTPPPPGSPPPLVVSPRASSPFAGRATLLPRRPPPPPPTRGASGTVSMMRTSSTVAAERALNLASTTQEALVVLPGDMPGLPPTALTHRKSKSGGRRGDLFRNTPTPSDVAEAGTSTTALAGDDSPPRAVMARICVPFASPFAQVSQREPFNFAAVELEDTTEDGHAGSMADLVMQQASGSFTLVNPSRKSSSNLKRAFSKLRADKSMKRQATAAGEMWRVASIQGFAANEDDDDCGICLDEAVDVAVSGCHHKLCVSCAIKLCEINKKPPLCPFCRVFIERFEAA